MSYEKQNFTDGQVLKAEHLNKMEQGIEKANGIIGEVVGDTLTWDGNTEGLVGVLDVFYKVSGVVWFTGAEFVTGCSIVLSTSEILHFPIDAIMEVPVGIAIGNGYAWFVSEDGVGVDMGDGLVFQEAGVYLMKTPEFYVSSLTIPGYTGFANEKLDQKYLPDTVKLYYDSDKYLYTTSNTNDTRKRLTKNELCSIMISAKKVLIAVENDSVVLYCTPTAYTAPSGLAYATLYAFGGTDGTGTIFYTAEYTPPTT